MERDDDEGESRVLRAVRRKDLSDVLEDMMDCNIDTKICNRYRYMRIDAGVILSANETYSPASNREAKS